MRILNVIGLCTADLVRCSLKIGIVLDVSNLPGIVDFLQDLRFEYILTISQPYMDHSRSKFALILYFAFSIRWACYWWTTRRFWWISEKLLRPTKGQSWERFNSGRLFLKFYLSIRVIFYSQNFSTRMTYLNKKFSISLNFKAT